MEWCRERLAEGLKAWYEREGQEGVTAFVASVARNALAEGYAFPDVVSVDLDTSSTPSLSVHLIDELEDETMDAVGEVLWEELIVAAGETPPEGDNLYPEDFLRLSYCW